MKLIQQRLFCYTVAAIILKLRNVNVSLYLTILIFSLLRVNISKNVLFLLKKTDFFASFLSKYYLIPQHKESKKIHTP